MFRSYVILDDKYLSICEIFYIKIFDFCPDRT